MKIDIPRLSTSNALSFCKNLPGYDNDDVYYFDVSAINNYEPLPMLLVSTAIRQFSSDRQLSPQNIQLRFKDTSDYQYACHMGFFQAAGFPQGKAPGEASGSSSYIPITKINISELQKKAFENGDILEQGDIIEREAKRLSKILAQRNPELQKLLQYLIREAIRNIPEHAETNDVWICGQYWRNRKYAEIAILDEGIGIFKSLSQNRIHRNYIDSNEEALKWAIKPGVSVAFDPSKGNKSRDTWANSGYGLFMISEICKLTNGRFTIVSGDNCLRVFSNAMGNYGVHINGTALGIRIGTTSIDNYQTIINLARSNGEETSKNIKNAFKEASVPSKGLLL